MEATEQRPNYRCLICTSHYKDPRLLSCGHTFCWRCLTSYIKANHVTADDDRHNFPCPVCEAPIFPNDVNTDVSTWATCFPISNLFVDHKEQTSVVSFCVQCLRGKESNPAEVLCIDCNQLLCKQCKAFHERSRTLSKHRLVSISGNVGELHDELVIEICQRHGGKPFDAYCVDHSAICCCICVLESHRQRNDVKQIEEVVQNTKPSPDETECKKLIEETRKILDEDDLGITTLNAREREVSVEVTSRIQEAKDKLDRLNTKFQSDLECKCKARRQQLSSRRKAVNTFHINAENSNLMMSRSRQKAEGNTFFLTEHTKSQISVHYRRMDQITTNIPNKFDITLKSGTIVDETMQVTTLGNVDLTSSLSTVSQNAKARISTLIGTALSTPLPSACSVSTFTSDLSGSLQHRKEVDVWTGSVSCVQTVNSRALGGIFAPCLTGGIFTDNNELLTTDRGNNRLLHFDDKYSYLREYKVNSCPTGISRGRTAEEIFVVVDEGQILRCTLVNDQLSVINKIGCPRQTCGIAVIGENILVSAHKSVKVMTVDGKITRSIKNKGVCTYLAISTYRSTVYHGDGNDVVCRQLDSDAVVYKYSDPCLRYPTGIGLDPDDNVYVAGWESRNVCLVSPDGSRGRVLVPSLSDITYPYCIAVHPTKQEFVITSYGEYTSMEVYTFSDNNI